MTAPQHLRLGTRGSQLALTQSRWVQAALQQQYPGLTVELVTITTSGDRFTTQPLTALGGKGLFLKEIEEALCAKTIDCAVHSMKDVPADLAPGCTIAAIPAREDPRDVFISRDGTPFDALPAGAVIGTSSPRRAALVQLLRRDLRIANLRGNVGTRLRRLQEGDIDAIILAAAGLRRLGLEAHATEYFAPTRFLPAIGQGALAIESRTDETATWLAVLDDRPTRYAIEAERAFLAAVSGSCHTPMAAYATIQDTQLTLEAVILSPDGQHCIRDTCRGAVNEAQTLGRTLADAMLAAGGTEILQALGIHPPQHP